MMISRNRIIVAGFFGVFFTIVALNYRFAGTRFLGAYVDGRNVVYLNADLRKSGPEQMACVAVHELTHSMRDFGVIDFDVPFASAEETKTEVIVLGNVPQATRRQEYLSALKSKPGLNEVEALLKRYRVSGRVRETEQSYVDGAWQIGRASCRERV